MLERKDFSSLSNSGTSQWQVLFTINDLLVNSVLLSFHIFCKYGRDTSHITETVSLVNLSINFKANSEESKRYFTELRKTLGETNQNKFDFMPGFQDHHIFLQQTSDSSLIKIDGLTREESKEVLKKISESNPTWFNCFCQAVDDLFDEIQKAYLNINKSNNR